MGVILVWLVASLVIIVERALYLFSAHQDPEVFQAVLHQCVAARRLNKAISISASARSPLGRIMMQGFKRFSEGPKAFQAGMDQQALKELPLINRRIGYLALFANLSMLSGLFGTIVGLIKSFGAVGSESVDASQKARLLAEGISEAMNCTAFGLLAAIVALLGYAALNTWAQNIEDSIHRETAHLYNVTRKYFLDP